MLREERRRSGVDVEKSVGRAEWRRVIGTSCGGIIREGSERREGYILRGVEDVGVTTRLFIGMSVYCQLLFSTAASRNYHTGFV